MGYFFVVGGMFYVYGVVQVQVFGQGIDVGYIGVYFVVVMGL